MSTLQKGLWTFLPVNFGALLRKRKHYVETRRLWVYLKREGRETLRRTVIHQNGSKSHQILARSESRAPSAWWAVANLAEQGSTLLRAQGWRAPLPALCPPCVHWPDCRAQQNTGGPVRETQWALLSRTDRETGRYREQVSEGVDTSRGQDWWRDGNLDGGNQGWVGMRRFAEWFWGFLLGSIKPSGLEKGLERKGRSLEGKGNTNKWMHLEMSGVWGGGMICRSLERQIWDLVTLQFMCAC